MAGPFGECNKAQLCNVEAKIHGTEDDNVVYYQTTFCCAVSDKLTGDKALVTTADYEAMLHCCQRHVSVQAEDTASNTVLPAYMHTCGIKANITVHVDNHKEDTCTAVLGGANNNKIGNVHVPDVTCTTKLFKEVALVQAKNASHSTQESDVLAIYNHNGRTTMHCVNDTVGVNEPDVPTNKSFNEGTYARVDESVRMTDGREDSVQWRNVSFAWISRCLFVTLLILLCILPCIFTRRADIENGVQGNQDREFSRNWDAELRVFRDTRLSSFVIKGYTREQFWEFGAINFDRHTGKMCVKGYKRFDSDYRDIGFSDKGLFYWESGMQTCTSFVEIQTVRGLRGKTSVTAKYEYAWKLQVDDNNTGDWVVKHDLFNDVGYNVKLPFIIRFDSSDYAIASCLSQCMEDGLEKPISFASCKLTDVQRQWSTIEKEAYAVIISLRKFDYLVYGRKILLFSDHNALSYLTVAAPKSAKLTRWALSLSRYDIFVNHIKGKDNVVADCLFRC